MHAEQAEKRDFLPEFVAGVVGHGAEVYLEEGYGSGIGLSPQDYLQLAPSVSFIPHDQVYQQDYILLVRCPDDLDLLRMQPGACLMTMLHYPTRPERVRFLRSLDIEAVSLDSILDDSGRRLVENLQAVAWNGMEIAFRELKSRYPAPGFESPSRKPVYVTQMGSGAVGAHVMQAAIRYGNRLLWQELASRGVPGVQLIVLDYDLTGIKDFMLYHLSKTDILVDATQRPDPSKPVIPNTWLADVPQHAILVDLSVDPYDCTGLASQVKGIEGIPQGNLDRYVFPPDDPAYESIPDCIPTEHRRTVVSCYSWPGIHPKECMQVYGQQLRPILRTIIQKGGIENIRADGAFFERAISRARLSTWQNKNH
jgi:alanine dehydrogenase